MRWFLVVTLLVVGCSTGEPSLTETTQAASITIADSTTTVPSAGGSSSPSATETGREAAPDFTLALNDGGSYTLSEGSRPVYLVFWAEWCPVCRRELPVVDRISMDYAGRIDFVAPAWKSGEEAAIAAAAELFPSGNFLWGLDPEEVIFELYGVPYQPVTVLIGSDRTVVEAWAGVRAEEDIRAAVDNLLAIAG
jgi:thiol-disulfide isomerase/thioredoxin